MKEKVIVRVPARIHMGVWDMNQFGLGKRGGGGVGLAIGLYTTVSGSIASEDRVKGESSTIAKKFLDSIKEILNVKDVFFDINISRDYEMHVGLGSTGSVLVGMIRFVAEILEIELKDEEIIEIALDAMKEEHDGKITECFETAVGLWACLKRQMVVVDEKCNLVNICQLDNDLQVLLVTPSSDGLASSIEDETVLLEGRGKELDREAYDLKKYLLSYIRKMDTTSRKDLSVIKIVDILKYIGSKRAEIEYQEKIHSGLYSELIKLGESSNCLLSGMSSIGPAYYYIDNEKQIKKICERLDGYNVNIRVISVDHFE